MVKCSQSSNGKCQTFGQRLLHKGEDNISDNFQSHKSQTSLLMAAGLRVQCGSQDTKGMTCHYITSSYHFGIQIQLLDAVSAYLACCHPVCQFGRSVKVKETRESPTAGSPHLRFLYSPSDYVQQSQFAQRILLPKWYIPRKRPSISHRSRGTSASTPGHYRIHYIRAL